MIGPAWLPYGRQDVADSDVDAVVTSLRSDWLTTGPEVARFEAALAARVGDVSCISVTSGTAALHCAYGSLGSLVGQQVVTTPFTFIATASSAAMLGADIVFADVEDDTLNLDPMAAAAAVGPRTRAITAVDYAGHPADMPALREVSDAAGAVLIEDAAHSLGGGINGQPVGTLADLTCFSFFPTKHMTTCEGGAVVTPDSDLAQRVRAFARIGRDPEAATPDEEGGWWYEMSSFGLNYRLPDVLCALGTAQLERLPTFLRRRAGLVARYSELLKEAPGLRLPTTREGVDPAWHLYAVRVLDGRRRELYDALRGVGIGAQVNYIPVYWHPVFADLGYRRGLCPVAEQAYSEQLSLPLFPGMSDSDQDRVVDAVLKHLR